MKRERENNSRKVSKFVLLGKFQTLCFEGHGNSWRFTAGKFETEKGKIHSLVEYHFMRS